MKAILLLVCAATASITADARIQRSQTARHEFVRQQACPATGRHRLPCPGWQIDHITPLKCAGPDTPENMQWLTIQAHKAKTRREARWCVGALEGIYPVSEEIVFYSPNPLAWKPEK